MVVKRASFCLAVVQRQESCVAGSSYVSLTDVGKSTAGKGPGKKQKGSATPGASGANYGSTTLLRQPSHVDLSKCFGKSSYFSDINPRSMKRLMNILAVTGWLANQLLCVSVCLSVCLFVLVVISLACYISTTKMQHLLGASIVKNKQICF